LRQNQYRRGGRVRKSGEGGIAPRLSLAGVRRVIASAEKKAIEIGQPINIAVVDGVGKPDRPVRMDNA